ncbi:MAG TPA: putative aminohydrolase SsnA [Anaerolineae bacterium]|nr:putative aminohydrolase SsnA [Anaerolineae bacterium]HID84858.1 putative aminohydrolase SsnA [Anaerolineales bacterium]HIQ09790.1 putative aminohydrolase SsnA [Anaerolineaceae bacterium]
MLVTHAMLVTWDEERRLLPDHALLVRDGIITDLGPSAEMEARYPAEERLDARGQWVMPGQICAHTHFYGAFARGMAIPGPAPKDFPEILQRLWWPLDQALDEEAVRLSAEVMLVDAIRNGVTTLFDHHASPNALEGSLDVIAEVVQRAGVRAVLAYEVTDRYGKAKARTAIEENRRFAERVRRDPAYGTPQQRLAATFGLHASLTLDEDTLAAAREACPPEVGFHIHLAEHPADEDDSLRRTGERAADRLSRHGILGEGTIVAHGVHIDAREMLHLAETGTWLSHQPRSNMNNAVGAARVEEMLRLGVRVVLGTDGFPHAMWEEMRFAYLLPKLAAGDPRRMDGNTVMRIAVENNRALAERYFPGVSLGRLTRGAAADLIFVDWHPHTPVTPENLPWHLLFGAYERQITTTIVAGRVLMRDGALLTLDEEAIAARAREKAPQVWEAYRPFVPH